MREHPIPQDITGYKFHIIGSMTLKQFVEIALGVGLAALFYSTNLPAAIKYPLMLFSGVSGGLIAFLPIEERPLDHWILTFIRVMYKPTQFFWKREAHVPEVFSFTPNMSSPRTEMDVDLGPVKKERIREYLTSVPNVEDPYSFDSDEIDRMNAILGTFSSVKSDPTTAKSRRITKPKLGVRVRNLRPLHQENVVYSAEGQALPQQNATHAVGAVPSSDSALTDMYTQRNVLAKQQQDAKDVAQEIAIPETQLIAVVDPNKQAVEAETDTTSTPAEDSMTFMGNEAYGTKNDQTMADQAEFNTNLPFPESPSEPNKLVGMVLSPNTELIVNAIIEILQQDGTVARAVKTNALGQFFVTTPLANGNYTITVDKDGFSFEPMSIQLTGDLVQPIEVRSLS